MKLFRIARTKTFSVYRPRRLAGICSFRRVEALKWTLRISFAPRLFQRMPSLLVESEHL